MARDNYSYKKYQRELTKKKKKEEKLLKKLNKKNAVGGEGVEATEAAVGGLEPGIVESSPDTSKGSAGVADAGSGQSEQDSAS